ncbi:MAG: ankyrin repeat domain-containing protein [Streptosporangiaceae bacterium]
MADLPDEPSYEQLRNQAKDLRRAVLAGEPAALAEVAEHFPAAPAPFPLHAAQLVVARRYGFPSWARLKRHVEVIERYSRFPNRMTAGAPASLADQFLRLVTAYYADQPERWAQGRRLLAEHPEITADNVHAAAAAADTAALRRILAADPAAARHEGGPFQWPPLFYLAYSRHDPQVAEAAVLTAARLLLDAGADPNAGYLFEGLCTPFTVLTGVFGEGEQGPVRQPRHPHSLALARLLLQAGADPNDGQALYNRMFEPGNDHLELLFEFGLGAGDSGLWRRRLGDAVDTPAGMLRGELAWAITHGMTERVRLLVSHGVDVTAPFERGATATSMAATTGHPDLIDYLVANGAPPPALDPAEAFVASALAPELGSARADLDRLLREHPGLADQVRAARPALITWAAACGRPEAVEILAGLGFDVNAKGRTDVPSDQPWQTALHHAAGSGNLEMARTLLRLGADPDIRDHRFDSTPLSWARHFDQQPLIDLLEPLTAPELQTPDG